MPQIVGPLIVLLGLLLLLNIFLRSSPAKLAVVVRWVVSGTLMLLGMLSLTRGLLPLAFGFFALSILSLGAGGLLAEWARWGQKSSGQASQVRTKVLVMDLDHDSGKLDGQIIAGTHTGRRLSELDLEQLMEVRRDCLAANDQSARLLDAYLDRYHASWRDTHSSDDESQSAGQGGGAMSVAEAYEILGLSRGASKSDIRRAHRALMKKFHPDHGGSEYLAQRINEARDLLMGNA